MFEGIKKIVQTCVDCIDIPSPLDANYLEKSIAGENDIEELERRIISTEKSISKLEDDKSRLRDGSYGGFPKDQVFPKGHPDLSNELIFKTDADIASLRSLIEMYKKRIEELKA